MIAKNGITNIAELNAAMERATFQKSKYVTRKDQLQAQINGALTDTTDYPAVLGTLEVDISMITYRRDNATDPLKKQRLTEELNNLIEQRAATQAHLRNFDRFSMIERKAALDVYSRYISEMLDYMVELEAMRPTLAAA